MNKNKFLSLPDSPLSPVTTAPLKFMLTGKNFNSTSFSHVISIHCILKDKINRKPKRRPIIFARLNRARGSHNGTEFKLRCRFPFRRQTLNPRSGVKIQRQKRVRSDLLQAPQHGRVRGKPLKLVNKRSPVRWPTNNIHRVSVNTNKCSS